MNSFSSFWQVIMILPGYIHSIYIFFIIYRLWRCHFFKLFIICTFKDPKLLENKLVWQKIQKKNWTPRSSWSLFFPSRLITLSIDLYVFIRPVLYIANCFALNTVHCTAHHCTPLHCPALRCTALLIVNCTLYTVHCTLHCTVHCTPPFHQILMAHRRQEELQE